VEAGALPNFIGSAVQQAAVVRDRAEPELQLDPSAPGGDPKPPPQPAKKQASYKAYDGYQRGKKENTGKWSTREEDDAWAKANGYATRHVRDELRPKFVKTLPPEERVEFQKPGKRTRISPAD
jgi:hypothetical protein